MTDLYQGSAQYYDQYRLAYPEALLVDLVARAKVSGDGRLLDLACGTGQLAFPLRRWFREVWAADQEADMMEVVRVKASAMGAEDVRPVVASAETLDAPLDYFELTVIGNAFHRLNRDVVASRVLEWLQPGGHLALCWSAGPWSGDEDWQQALEAVLDIWRAALGAQSRVPAGWDLPRKQRPDLQVLADAGFEVIGRQQFGMEHRWSVQELSGYIRSTSFLPATVLGDEAAAFDADLAAKLGPLSHDGTFTQDVSCAYDLVRKPG